MNPIAGMGGAVGLKGTDGLSREAAARGARPLAPERARACLRLLLPRGREMQILTASGEMGERVLRECGLECTAVYDAPETSVAEDTKGACRAILRQGAVLILFCGGDGTARDVTSVVGDRTAVLGIPAGVKMHSGVFAVSPEAAAELALGFLRGELKATETEIVDVDEELYRKGELQTKLYAAAKTPYKPVLVQERKRIYTSISEEVFKDQIAAFAKEFMRDGSAYILGAGTTIARIAGNLGIEKTLLGVDVVQNGSLILKDASEKDLLELLDKEKSVKIIVSPIGAQGFILGRGSQQISAEVLRRAGVDNLIIVSTPHKLAELPHLLIYTGDPLLDKLLCGSGKRRVVTGYRMAQLKAVRSAADPVALSD